MFGHDFPRCEHDAWDERFAAVGVVAQAQRLAQAAKGDVVVGNEARHALRVDGDALVHSAAGIGGVFFSGMVCSKGLPRAAAISCAMKYAVPDGASSFFSW